MKQLIEYFDRSYIINLLDRTDRRRQVVKEFMRVGINVPNEKVRFYNATRPTDKAGFENIGTRGCFLSHKNILELSSRDRLKNVLIFEDDVSFRAVKSAFEQNLINQIRQKDWDILYFGYLLPPDDALMGPLVGAPNDVRGTHFYAVNGKFIGTLLQYMTECEWLPLGHPYGGPISPDAVYNHMRYVVPKINAFLSAPSLAHQRSSRTDVTPTGILDGIGWLRPILRGARALKHRRRMALDKKKLHGQLNREPQD
jgi:glycosyl transferase, family 25